MKKILIPFLLFLATRVLAQVNPPTITQNLGSPVTNVNTKGSAQQDSNLSVMVSAANLYSPVDTIILTGTSVTSGTGATVPAQNYASILCGIFGMVQDNEGVAGMALSKPPGYVGSSFMNIYTTAIPPKRPHLRYLVLEWGENDSFFQFTGAGAFTQAGYTTDYTTVLNYALAQGWTKATIIICAPEWQLPGRCPKVNQDSFYNATLALATTFGLRIANDYLSDQPINGADKVDGVHPSNYGHARKAYIISTVWDSANMVAKKYGFPYISQINQIWEAKHVMLRGVDSPQVGAAVAGIDPSGNFSAFPQEYFAQFRPPIPSVFQSGGLYATGDGYFNGNGQYGGFRVTGIGSFPAGSGPGFELYVQGNDGHLLPFNRTGAVPGNVFADQGSILQGVGTVPTKFNTTGIYSNNIVQGTQGTFTGGFSQPNVSAILLGFFQGGGYIYSYNGTSFFPTIINDLGQPVLIQNHTDNGKGALQVAGHVTAQHLVGTTAAPTSSALGTNVTSVTFDAAADDLGFTMTVVTSAAVSGTICTVTSNKVYSAIPHPLVGEADPTTAAGSSAMWLTAASTNTFTFGGTIPVAGTYHFSVLVIQ